MTVAPSCSTCGLAVEWLRSCYQSKWSLLKGQGRPLTPGRYYFSPQNTPFYAGISRLSSRNWYDRNAIIGESLGEDLDAAHVWDNGAMPPIMPGLFAVGSAQCLSDGEEAKDAVQGTDLVGGFAANCFVSPPILTDPWPAVSAYDSCSIQAAYAKMISWTYLGLDSRTDALLELMLGPSYTISHFAESGSFPASVIAVSPEATVVVLTGTSSFQQFALQAAYALVPPTNQGIFSTLPAWYLASTNLHFQLLTALANPTGPIYFAGHSYGAALCMILAARYRAANPDRLIRFCTYGMPKIGDRRLSDILRQTQGISLCNTNDIVPTLPPNANLVAQLITFLGVPELLTWPPWLSGPNTQRMEGGGEIQPDANPSLDFYTAFAFAVDVLGSIPYPSISEHVIDEYFKRILTRCPLPEWPLTPAEYALMLAP